MVVDLRLPMQSVLITTQAVSSNAAHGEVYLMQLYVIQVVSDVRQVCGFIRVLWYPLPIKLTAMIKLIYC
jgi:hypothetical protein